MIDPWTFSLRVGKLYIGLRLFAKSKQVLKDDLSGGLKVTLLSRERLDLNISTTFTELAITTMNMLGKDNEQVLAKARGSYAPYRIQNCTGSAIYIWSDTDGSGNATDPAAVKIAHDQTVDWRFDDWKTMREVIIGAFLLNFTDILLCSTSLRRGNTALQSNSSVSHGSSYEAFLWTRKENSSSLCVLERRSSLTVCYAK